MIFLDRTDAGNRLADRLNDFEGKQAVVFAIPRGGVVVGNQISKRLHLPLNVIVIRKIGFPNSSELGIGAIAADGHRVLDMSAVETVNLQWLKQEENLQRLEAVRRERLYYGERQQYPVKGKTAILVDDGIATGFTIMVGIKELMHLIPGNIVVAVPVCSPEASNSIQQAGCRLVALDKPAALTAISVYYQSFPQVTDNDVVRILMERNNNV